MSAGASKAFPASPPADDAPPMRRLATSLLIGALLAGWGLLVATPAAACSCAVPPDVTAYYVDTADIVFAGRLVPTVEHPGGEISSSLDPAHVFAVDSVFKGAVRGERQDVVSADLGASCGLELAGEGPFVVFAIEEDGGHTAGLCGGTTLATPELEAELAALAGPPLSPGGGPGHPAWSRRSNLGPVP